MISAAAGAAPRTIAAPASRRLSMTIFLPLLLQTVAPPASTPESWYAMALKSISRSPARKAVHILEDAAEAIRQFAFARLPPARAHPRAKRQDNCLGHIPSAPVETTAIFPPLCAKSRDQGAQPTLHLRRLRRHFTGGLPHSARLWSRRGRASPGGAPDFSIRDFLDRDVLMQDAQRSRAPPLRG